VKRISIFAYLKQGKGREKEEEEEEEEEKEEKEERERRHHFRLGSKTFV
jgi:hypothetical protein